MGIMTCELTISADGYSAGLNQTEERPVGDDGGNAGATNCTLGWPKLPGRSTTSARRRDGREADDLVAAQRLEEGLEVGRRM